MILGGFDQTYISVMAQVGVTAFALMFAAVQFRWETWSSTRMGILAAATSLLELLTVTLVSVAILSQFAPLWVLTALSASVVGICGTTLQRREFRDQMLRGYFPTPGDSFQMSASWLPYVSYGALALGSVTWVLTECRSVPFPAPLDREDLLQASVTAVSVDIAWLLFSGLTETLVTLSPHLLDPEKDHEVESVELPESSTHALKVCRVAGSGNTQAPAESGRQSGGLVLLPEIWGVTPDVWRIAKRFANMGFVVLVPDYYRGRRGFRMVWRALGGYAASVEEAVRMAREARSALICSTPQSIDVVGMSMGATAALKEPDKWRRVVALYPDDPASKQATETPDAVQVSAPNAIVFVAAHEKLWCRANERQRAMQHAVQGARVDLVSSWHSYFGGRSAPAWSRALLLIFRWTAYDRSAAETSWREIEFFLASELRPTPDRRDEPPAD